jgi:hypothetical protein
VRSLAAEPFTSYQIQSNTTLAIIRASRLYFRVTNPRRYDRQSRCMLTTRIAGYWSPHGT